MWTRKHQSCQVFCDSFVELQCWEGGDMLCRRDIQLKSWLAGTPFPLLSLSLSLSLSVWMGTLLWKALISCSWPILLYSQENSAALPNSEENLQTATGGKHHYKRKTFPCMCATSHVHIGIRKEFDKKFQKDKSMNVEHSGTHVLARESVSLHMMCVWKG